MKLLRNEVSFGYEVKFAPCASAHFIASATSYTAGVLHLPQANFIEKSTCDSKCFFLVGEDGFEPSKRNAADLQSVPFGHSGTPPYSVVSERLGYYSTDFGFVKGENEEKRNIVKSRLTPR